MKKAWIFLQGWRTMAFFGGVSIASLGLLIWCHFEPGLLSDAAQSALETALLMSLAAMGLRTQTTTKLGSKG